VAVKKSRRGEHLGEKIMQEAMKFIALHNGHEILLTAQSEVKRFYECLGFEQDGDVISFESGFVLVPMKYVVRKHVVITGGANGIGKGIAETFLRECAIVTVIDIDDSAGDVLQEAHANLRFFHGDIAEKETLERFVDYLSQPVDFLINNACIGRRGILSSCSYEDFEYVQRVGVTAPYYLTSLLLQRNLLAPNASVVNISSTRANQSQPDTEAYSAAKGGISALTHALAVSLAGKARVNAINPGWIDTTDSTFTGADATQHPAGHVGKPSDIAEMVLFLCSEKAGFITGESITIDGGMSRLMVYHGDHGWELK
jgi:NAD(P)-dependent dehydrogenase (short-subunit alcohol dehydrogenase family)